MSPLPKPVRDASMPPKMTPKPVEITWRCPEASCGARNYSHHGICLRCGAAKPILFVEER